MWIPGGAGPPPHTRRDTQPRTPTSWCPEEVSLLTSLPLPLCSGLRTACVPVPRWGGQPTERENGRAAGRYPKESGLAGKGPTPGGPPVSPHPGPAARDFPPPLSHDPGLIGLPKFKSVLEPGWPSCTHQRPRPGWSATLRTE